MPWARYRGHSSWEAGAAWQVSDVTALDKSVCVLAIAIGMHTAAP
jgi:hypothetical protein